LLNRIPYRAAKAASLSACFVACGSSVTAMPPKKSCRSKKPRQLCVNIQLTTEPIVTDPLYTTKSTAPHANRMLTALAPSLVSLLHRYAVGLTD